MEKTLEVIFDYACPYCYKAHSHIKELSKEIPNLRIQFTPCEAHPRPEHYGPHSDLCIMGMYYCLDNNIDILQYHELIYKAIFVDKINIENASELSAYISKLTDKEAFKKALSEGLYQKKAEQNNHYAWEQLNLPAVPSFSINNKLLYATPDVGVTKRQIKDLLSSN